MKPARRAGFLVEDVDFAVDADEIGRLIGELETRVERLRALYEQYFMGIERLEPLTVRKDVDRRLWVLRREQIRNTGLRFKLETTIQRYNTYQQYWQRIVREIEAGTYQRDLGRAAQRFGENAVTGFAKRRQKMFEKGLSKKAERDALRRTGAQASSQVPPAEAGDEAPPSSNETYDVTFEDSEVAEPASPRSPPVPMPEPHVPLELEISEPAPPPPPRRERPGPFWAAVSPTADQRKGPPPAPPAAAAPAPALGAQRPATAAAPSADAKPPAPAANAAPPAYAKPPTPAANPAAAQHPAPPPPPPRAPMPSAAGQGVAPPSPAANRDMAPPPVRPAPPAPGPAKPGASPPAPARPAAPAAPAKPAVPVATPARPAVPTGTVARPAVPAAAPAKPATPIGTPAKPAAAAPRAPAAASANAAKPDPPAAPRAPAVRPPGGSRPDSPATAVLGEDTNLSPIRMRQIYGAFVEAKRRANESTASVTYEKIASNLENVAKELRAKHNARSIDFEVVMKNGKPVLKPVVKG